MEIEKGESIPSTVITFSPRELFGVNMPDQTITVQFTAEEVDTLNRAWQAMKKLQKRALTGSGHIRNFYTDSPVPAARVLMDREKAMAQIRKARDNAKDLLDIERGITLEERVAVEEVFANLSLILPPIPEIDAG